MNVNLIKDLLNACFVAKKITELTPVLPKGLKPRHLSVLDTIYNLKKKQGVVYVSDVSTKLNITPPSVTTLINELVHHKFIVKLSTKNDKRKIQLNITAAGKRFYKIYIKEYHQRLCTNLQELDEEECRIMVNTLNQLYQLMLQSNTGISYK
jgi:DNA-binding MarR family transcriptional regulator